MFKYEHCGDALNQMMEIMRLHQKPDKGFNGNGKCVYYIPCYHYTDIKCVYCIIHSQSDFLLPHPVHQGNILIKCDM